MDQGPRSTGGSPSNRSASSIKKTTKARNRFDFVMLLPGSMQRALTCHTSTLVVESPVCVSVSSMCCMGVVLTPVAIEWLR